MTLIVKIMSDDNLPDDDSRKTYTMYGNVQSVSWVRQGDDYCFARMYIRDDVKTAAVQGFSEHEVRADIGSNCNAYVMNDRGKTIGSFCATPIAARNDESLTGTGSASGLTGGMMVNGTIKCRGGEVSAANVNVIFGRGPNATGITLLPRPYSGHELYREMGVDEDRMLSVLAWDETDWKTIYRSGKYFPASGDRFRESPE